MYQCKNCGNKEKFIGFAEEKGNVLIYQNCPDDACIKEMPDYMEIPLNIKIKDTLITGNDTKNLYWYYFISDNSWRSNLRIKKCYYCLSEDIMVSKD